MNTSAFDITPDTMVVTTRYVTQDRMPVVYVSHEIGEESEVIWQFHSANEDYRPEVLQLVRLDTILAIDPGLASLGRLAVGFSARRKSAGERWIVSKDPPE
jgi:hypothetical protein